MSGRKLARRACDGCKIRKIKCDERSPCSSCSASSIPCTWLKQAQPRGPRKLRESTLQEIKKTQQLLHHQTSKNRDGGQSTNDAYSSEPDPPPEPSSEIANLVLKLCMYRLQLFPLWPIVKIERLIASLQSTTPDIEVFAMAYALAAATLAQLKSNQSTETENAMAATMESRCQAAKSRCPPGRPPNVTTVRVAFFLHLFHENQEPGGMKSMLYLRESIAVAQMIGLHRESYYRDVRLPEQQIRRRILWLLYVAEREASILHKQPVTLKTKIGFPSTHDSDEADVLTGFQKMVSLFWNADEAGLFEALEQTEHGTISFATTETRHKLVQFQRHLTDINQAEIDIHTAQGLNLAVSCQWLLIVCWRLLGDNVLIEGTNELFVGNSKAVPDQAAAVVVNALNGVSASVMQIHGPDMRLKIFEIARALVDIHCLSSTRDSEALEDRSTFQYLLGQLHRHILPEPKLAISLHFEAMKLGDQMIAAVLEEQRSTGFVHNEDHKSTPGSGQGNEYTSPYAESPASNQSGNYLWLEQSNLEHHASRSTGNVHDTSDWTFSLPSDMDNPDAMTSSNILDDLSFPMTFDTSQVFDEHNF